MTTSLQRCAAGLVLASVIVVPQVCLGEGTREIQVASRTLGFLEKPLTGKVVIAVVFDRSKPESVAEKDEVMATVGTSMAAGGVTVTARALDESALGSAGDVNALYLTHGVNYAAAGQAGRVRHILTISSDMDCVRGGACVMGVATAPKVQIVVNRAAAAAAGISFKAAFRMMIKEI